VRENPPKRRIGVSVLVRSETEQVLDAGAATRQPDDSRDQKQQDRDKENDLGDFDGRAGNAAKAIRAMIRKVTTQLNMADISASTSKVQKYQRDKR